MDNHSEVPHCQICEKKPGFKTVHSKKYKEDVWICESCLAFGKIRGHFSAKEASIKRNDPCPCGSGKKFKKCCSSRVREHEEKVED